MNHIAVMTRKVFLHFIYLVGESTSHRWLPNDVSYVEIWCFFPCQTPQAMWWFERPWRYMISLQYWYTLSTMFSPIYGYKVIGWNVLIVDHVDKEHSMGHATLTVINGTIIQLLSHLHTVARISCLSHNDVMTWTYFPHYVDYRRTHP